MDTISSLTFGSTGCREDSQEELDWLANNSHSASEWLESIPETELPKSCHLVLDSPPQQNLMLSCAGAASKTAGEAVFRLATRTGSCQISQWAQYRFAQQNSHVEGDFGASFVSMLQAMKICGFAPQNICPMEPKRYSLGWRLPLHVVMSAKKLRIANLVRIHCFEHAYQFLATGQGPLLVTSDWPECFDQGGVRIEHFSEGKADHIYCISGWTTLDDKAYFVIPNTFYPDWGNNGFKLMSPKAFDLMCAHKRTLILGVTDLAVPRHPRIFEVLHHVRIIKDERASKTSGRQDGDHSHEHPVAIKSPGRSSHRRGGGKKSVGNRDRGNKDVARS